MIDLTGSFKIKRTISRNSENDFVLTEIGYDHKGKEIGKIVGPINILEGTLSSELIKILKSIPIGSTVNAVVKPD